MNYDKLNDYELINLAKESDDESKNIIIEKYMPLINKMASKMFVFCKNNGLEKSDLIQEGMIALTNAIESFDNTKDTIFYTYATACIQRKLISEIIKANRNKNKILNESISYDNDKNSIVNFLKDENANPEDIIIDSVDLSNTYKKITKVLTDYENQVFELLINGFKYKEIATMLEKDEKSIDNAIQRIKLKIKNELDK